MNTNNQKEAILVEAQTTVTMTYARFEALKTVEADKERLAQHVIEHDSNLSAANLRIKELETELEAFKSKSTTSKEVPVKKAPSKKK